MKFFDSGEIPSNKKIRDSSFFVIGKNPYFQHCILSYIKKNYHKIIFKKQARQRKVKVCYWLLFFSDALIFFDPDAEILSIMEKCRFLTAVLVGTLFYVILAFVGGRDGLWAQSQLQKQKQKLSAHTAQIEKNYDELSLEKLALQKDSDVIAALARKLGYVSEGEKLVKITGLPSRETHIFDPGVVVRHTDVKYIPEWTCKGLGLVILVLTYIMFLLYDLHRGNLHFSIKNFFGGSAGETTVYDMQ